MINWREKFLAFAIHFAVTLALAAGAAALIFFVWFPDPFDALAGGKELFALVVGCDLALGPLLSLVVYDGRKTRKHLFFDYSVIAILQLGALFYGVSIVKDSRPVYLAFVGDRLEIVTAKALSPKELAAAKDPAYARIPWWGIRNVAIRVPDADHNDALFESLSGNEEAGRPKFYVPYESQRAEILKHAKSIDELLARHPEGRAAIERALAGMSTPRERLRWLPIRTNKMEFWTVFIDAGSALPVGYANLDPY